MIKIKVVEFKRSGEEKLVIPANLAASIVARCGLMIEAQGMVCPNCGTSEVYADRNQPDNTDRWAWAIRPFKVDDWSHCLGCDVWFDLKGNLEK